MRTSYQTFATISKYQYQSCCITENKDQGVGPTGNMASMTHTTRIRVIDAGTSASVCMTYLMPSCDGFVTCRARLSSWFTNVNVVHYIPYMYRSISIIINN